MTHKLAVIGVGNMAKAIIAGIQKSDISVSEIILFDKNKDQYNSLSIGRCPYSYANSISDAINNADSVLLSVKPQNFTEILTEISQVEGHHSKLYITIAAGITVDSVSVALSDAEVVRVLPNIPMTIGKGVSVICKNENVSRERFDFVCSVFASAGSNILIEESDMNKTIGVTSSSPAYVFKFIDAIYKGALAQGLIEDGLIDAICDVFIGSALLLKGSGDMPQNFIERVASKGGTTEQALNKFDENNIEQIVCDAMIACTKRADELGSNKK